MHDNQHISIKQRGMGLIPADRMNRYAGFKLLIVDDHAHNLFTLRALVEKHMDVGILEAQSGQSAIDLTLTHPDIDLVILDVQMPEMDGFQTSSFSLEKWLGQPNCSGIA